MNRFVIADPHACIGCYTCEAACVNVHQEVGLVAYPRLTVTHTLAGTMPVQCRQCDDAPCEKVCPVKAITFEDNMVQLNESTCIGCKMCALACPFGVVTPYGTLPHGAGQLSYGALPLPIEQELPVHPLLNWTVGQRTVAVKCDLCHFRPEGPECVRVCPTKALHIVNDASLVTSEEEKRIASVGSLLASGSAFPHHPEA